MSLEDFSCHCTGKDAETHGDQVMCPVFHRGTGSIFPPDSLLNKLIKGNLIKGTGKCVCGFLYGFLMVVRERAKLQT